MVFVQVKARWRVVVCLAMAALFVLLMWAEQRAGDAKLSLLFRIAAIMAAVFIGWCAANAMTPIWTALGRYSFGACSALGRYSLDACLAGVGWYMVTAAVAALLFGFAGWLFGGEAFVDRFFFNFLIPSLVVLVIIIAVTIVFGVFGVVWTAIQRSRKRAVDKEFDAVCAAIKYKHSGKRAIEKEGLGK
jgi:hypothetical protein